MEILNSKLNKNQYKDILNFSYKRYSEEDLCAGDYNDFIDRAIFDLTTYDGSITEILVSKLIKICEAINNRTTFKFIENEQNYIDFITLLHFDFFKNRLNWGTSIRGAWWDETEYILDSNYLYHNNDKNYDKIRKITFNCENWIVFLNAVIEFYNEQQGAIK